MPFTLTLSNDYGYVLLAATSTFVLNIIHGFNTGKYRKPAGVTYPNAYASEEKAKVDQKAYLFNCAQRAHANYIENQPSVLAALLIAGLRYPIPAAVCGALWSVSRYMYMVGYCSGDAKSAGKGRYMGSGHYLAMLGLFGMSISAGVQMIRGL